MLGPLSDVLVFLFLFMVNFKSYDLIPRLCGLDQISVLRELVLSHTDLPKIIDDDDDEDLGVFGFYTLKYQNLNFTPEIYIWFA